MTHAFDESASRKMGPEIDEGLQKEPRRQISHSKLVERRSSKKSSSHDRHGKVYSGGSFGDVTIRAVTPESPPATSSSATTTEVSYSPSPASPSPQSKHRSRLPRGHREHSASVSNTEDEDTIENRRWKSKANTQQAEGTGVESSPSSFITKTRQRLGSITTSGSYSQKPGDDPSGSIGYPYVIQSPSLVDRNESRQRLANAFTPRTTSPPVPGNARKGGIFQNVPADPDSGKVSALMKITSGRMAGILSFRPANSAVWASGYCAINVASGSLIYQPNVRNPSNAKNLISDLRGCSVRTSYDAETGAPFLSVSTASLDFAVHLKPAVPETFESWLAALLCWQPLSSGRTKTRPSSVIEPPKSIRQEAGESENERSAAIIKVGKMLLWVGSPALGALYGTQKRVLTNKRIAQVSSWQPVACTLREDGLFKLLTDIGGRPVFVIPLSQLSRCAVQQLDSSVVDGEFCIAIYPQYTAVPGPSVQPTPVFLALESRIIFEVWFVLLRAFTVPELYGSERQIKQHASNQPQTLHMTQTSMLTGIFRIEKSLSVRLIEARWKDPAVSESGAVKKESGIFSDTGSTPQRDYYAEILIDDVARARTAVKTSNLTTFWREEFSFTDLPRVLSTIAVLVKAQNPGEKEWIMIAHGNYNISPGDKDPITGVDDIEVSAQDAVCGKIELSLDALDHVEEAEKRWPMVDVTKSIVGDVLMKFRFEETVVLTTDEYRPLSELLHAFTNGLTIQIARALSTELKVLSDIFMDIFQVSGHASEWLMSLVEEEIDGVYRESRPARMRYSRRIQSNDSEGSDREILVRDLGRSATVEANLLFRGNSLLTKALDAHMRRLGKEYLEETIGGHVRDIAESEPECEVDPSRVASQASLEKNWQKLTVLTGTLWLAISTSARRCPPDLRLVFRHIQSCADDRYGAFLRSVSYSSVSGFLFLRFFCAAILNPKLFGLLKDHPGKNAQRTFTLIAKSLIGLANMTTFGAKEPWMEPMNKFLLAARVEFKQFINQICSIPSGPQTKAVSPSYATPIQILGRLPATSREGFPSLPYLIDSAKRFANLVSLWLRNCPANLAGEGEGDGSLRKFHDICLDIQRRTSECLQAAERAQKPLEEADSNLEQGTEEGRRFSGYFEKRSSKTMGSPIEGPATTPPAKASGKRHSNGHHSASLSLSRRFVIPNSRGEKTPPSSASPTWDQAQLPFQRPLPGESGSKIASTNSSTLSLEEADPTRNPEQQSNREGSSKYRIFDLVGGSSRRKPKDTELSG